MPETFVLLLSIRCPHLDNLIALDMKRFLHTTLTFAAALLIWGCESSEPIIDHLETPQPTMSYSVSEVSQIRSQHNLDQRARAIDGVLSVGVSGKSNDDAWIQILCKDAQAIEKARAELGDSLAGVPIHFSLSDTIRAQ